MDFWSNILRIILDTLFTTTFFKVFNQFVKKLSEVMHKMKNQKNWKFCSSKDGLCPFNLSSAGRTSVFALDKDVRTSLTGIGMSARQKTKITLRTWLANDAKFLLCSKHWKFLLGTYKSLTVISAMIFVILYLLVRKNYFYFFIISGNPLHSYVRNLRHFLGICRNPRNFRNLLIFCDLFCHSFNSGKKANPQEK